MNTKVEDSYELTYFKNMGKKKADTVDPNVINDELIRKYVKEYNLENKIFGMDDMPFYNILELRLSFQNILKIQNLRGLSGLKKLCLDNNIIAKIEGLEELESLEWLDLSFNNISIIEGLSELVSLTDLSLFHNLITEYSGGLEKCTKLNILSLGDNKISSREPTLTNLRMLPNLQVLKLEGNEICNDDSLYKSSVIALIPQLKYLDYILIDQQEAIKAKETHREEIQARELTNAPADELEKKQQDKRREDLEEAFLGRTIDALEEVSKEYPDEESKIRVLPDQITLYEDFSEEFKKGIEFFQKTVMDLNKARLSMITKFNNSVQKAEEENEKEDIGHISNYERLEKNALKNFDPEYADEASEEALKAIFPEIDNLEHILIDKEMQLVERTNEAIERFEKNLKSVVDSIKEECKNFQEEMNKKVEAYFVEVDKIKEEQLKLFSAENVNLDNFTAEQREIYADREGLNNATSILQEEYKNMVFSIEEETNKAYEEELEQFIANFKDEKHERNRKHIREIMELVSDKRKKIDMTLESI